jgi:hypothetical protein
MKAGSFTGATILKQGAGYRSGSICLKGNITSGSGFSGSFSADPINGSLTSLSLDNFGSDYVFSTLLFELCFKDTTITQVRLSQSASYACVYEGE